MTLDVTNLPAESTKKEQWRKQTLLNRVTEGNGVQDLRFILHLFIDWRVHLATVDRVDYPWPLMKADHRDMLNLVLSMPNPSSRRFPFGRFC